MMKQVAALPPDDACNFNMKLFAFNIHRVIVPLSISIILLFVGGSSALGAIQTSIVVMAFPFMLLTLLMMISMFKDIIQSRRRAGHRAQ